ncbi:ABC transporter ATP-binding protein [Lacisediminimonas sp.]|uniref:ABC transporter ATP-binding protein n=1 Tax=Lacisediminimonas sp. TaxID=3060582 RepID=UPI0027215A85|nr:ABC transporter ATP-binding protein [Lacisediminimonas sp.]MDO8299263.1 ABC transporter ATP-binding protein [Lacisediminimonas sp.]
MQNPTRLYAIADDRQSEAATAMLQISAVSHTYSSTTASTLALDGIDLNIAPGEFVAIVGSSGCGKSTLLRIAAGLMTPSLGAALVDGAVVTGPRPDVGVIFQDAVMLPWFSVLENVVLPIRAAGGNLTKARRHAAELLDRVGLAGFHDAAPSQLSGGMRQRAAIVRALLSKPRLLLMDEPFGALDALTREQMNLELARIAEQSGCAVLLITHSISEAVFLSDRTIVMTPRPGRIAEEIAVPLPRPRAATTMLHPEFSALCHQVRGHFDGKGE